jgi:hypothetical protein
MFLIVESVEHSVVIRGLCDKGLRFADVRLTARGWRIETSSPTHKHGASVHTPLYHPGVIGIGDVYLDSRWEIDVLLELIAILVDPIHGVSNIWLSRGEFVASFAFHVVELRDTAKATGSKLAGQ